jgi:hypothetical protein
VTVSHVLGDCEIQHVNEDREVYEELAILGHEDESPLGNVKFESFVSVLPLDVAYSHAITTGLDGTWGHDTSRGSDEPHTDTSSLTGRVQVDTVRDDTNTGERNTEMKQFSQQVSHRENTSTPPVQVVISKLFKLRVHKDTGTGPGHRGVVSQRIRELMCDFGESSGSGFHQTGHLQQGGYCTYVCSTVCSGGVSCQGTSCEFQRWDELEVKIPNTRKRGFHHKCHT